MQRCGACVVLYQLPGLSNQGPESVDTVSVHYFIFEPVPVYCCSWEEGILSLYGVAVGHSVGSVVSYVVVDWVRGFAM